MSIGKEYKSWDEYQQSEIECALENTYGKGINPGVVEDLLDVIKKFLEVANYRWRSLPATSHEKNIMSSAKAAIKKATI
jgi:hypothetical protein